MVSDLTTTLGYPLICLWGQLQHKEADQTPPPSLSGYDEVAPLDPRLVTRHQTLSPEKLTNINRNSQLFYRILHVTHEIRTIYMKERREITSEECKLSQYFVSTKILNICIICVEFYELWRKNYKLFVRTDWRLSRLSHLKNLDSYKYIDHDIENFTASVINIKYKHYFQAGWSWTARPGIRTGSELEERPADDSNMQFAFVKFYFLFPIFWVSAGTKLNRGKDPRDTGGCSCWPTQVTEPSQGWSLAWEISTPAGWWM